MNTVYKEFYGVGITTGTLVSVNKYDGSDWVMSIPAVEENTDYQEFLIWKSEGRTIGIIT
tara:strand:- start:42 stop:221 length:180 start_codon:yes stop_codon:yes gene_type:complete